ncbi:attractin-like [Xenia sp. Carnegie-2017]|uniref:attractin-like n=1 Tax=Xenia sp. Carnegie-2017 TaxID=2897299 RepID=UPI001F0454FB|nr:attractin-like [Xenia sp. Carnegie-2017]
MRILLFLFLTIIGIECRSSVNPNCQCPGEKIQNGKCSPETNCKWLCNNGYWGEKCEYGRIRLTSRSGFITDDFDNYLVSSKRIWLIDTGNRPNVTIHFQIDELHTECNWDHLYIFDGDSTQSPLLAAFNGHLLTKSNVTFGNVPQQIIARSGKAFIYFYSDENEVRSGFNISYRFIDNCSCINGKCNIAGLCTCHDGWSGHYCDIPLNCSCVNGVCNDTDCHCAYGFTGKKCDKPITSSYWHEVEIHNTDSFISPRASHAAAIIGDHLWIYGGYMFSLVNNRTLNYLYRYDIINKTWTGFMSSCDEKSTWGHSMVAYQHRLFIFGGEFSNGRITDRLLEYNTVTKQCKYLNSSSIGVKDHTATVVGDKMIVLFGLSNDGPSSRVQEFDLGKLRWILNENKSTIKDARFGHTSVYDDQSKEIYIYGGLMIVNGTSTLLPSDSLISYNLLNRTWHFLPSSGFQLAHHSAVIMDKMILVFGGNPYVNGQVNKNRCHTTRLHLYDIACQKWYFDDLTQISETLARYGHSAVSKDRTMYIFGGFNGALFNDILSYTHGICDRITNESECLKNYVSSGCYWNNSRCFSKGSVKETLQCPGEYRAKCEEILSCKECTSISYCAWNHSSCRENESGDVCPTTGKYLNENSLSKFAKSSCSLHSSSKDCLSESCLWCENLGRCIHNDLYTAYYTYGQCFEWVTKNNRKDISCEAQETCLNCLKLPSCGWSENSLRNGLGRCLQGSARAPKDNSLSTKFWHFIHCPLCQCNGHSNCSVDSNVCLKCRDHSTGEKCERCAPGYYGNPSNGGKCKPCECNGHADTCNPVNGKCNCRMRGVIGDMCDRCLETQYEGNATNGGYCFYILTPGFLYKINVSDKKTVNFVSRPDQSDENAIVTVEINEQNKSNPTMLNISVGSDVMQEYYVRNVISLSSRYQLKFSKDYYSFGSHGFYFHIFLYNLHPNSVISISVHQPHEETIDLLKFFIVFISCFVGLLLLAVLTWKAKSFIETLRRNRRHNVEMVYMTNRPFAAAPICVDKPGYVPMTGKPSPLTSEICYGNKAAVVTVLVRLPVCGQSDSSNGASPLCLGSTLVNFGDQHNSKVVNYVKNIKRRRNPFCSTTT